jgi:hypothetical protein
MTRGRWAGGPCSAARAAIAGGFVDFVRASATLQVRTEAVMTQPGQMSSSVTGRALDARWSDRMCRSHETPPNTGNLQPSAA